MKKTNILLVASCTLLFVTATLFSGRANAQNLGRQYEWIKLMPEEIPVSGGEVSYSMDVKLPDLDKDQMKDNATWFFKNAFSSELFKNDKYKFVGFGNYTVNMANANAAEDLYTVNYILEINISKGKYEVTMRNFEIEHFDAKVNMMKRIDAAKTVPQARAFCTVFHKKNIQVLKSVYDVMDKKIAGENPTAAK
ncbi:MAG: DUF4468 domain-containing protein [Chitinophagia bacterium]|nr:DUF4468 domain-containing protein [Chitinophagia bacterium]